MWHRISGEIKIGEGNMQDILHRESVYLWYYFTIQFRQIFRYWLLGMVIGSAVSVFAKKKIHEVFQSLAGRRLGFLGIVAGSVLGIASPLCMYGTIPIAASFSKSGMRDSWLASFMMSSVLLNPQLILYSAALGKTALAVRIVSCFLCGIAAGGLVCLFYRKKPFFDFAGFQESKDRDTDPNLFIRFLKNFGRNIRATGIYFLAGILLSAVFQRYVPSGFVEDLFGGDGRFGIFMAATIGVPLYACGGGTIPLLQTWLYEGMGMGSAAAFMLTGPATKITNLGAVKIVLGWKRFLLYLVFIMVFAYMAGFITDILVY